MAITAAELNPKGYPLTKEQQANFDKLLSAMNVVRAEYGQPMIVTSGVRSAEDQTRIDSKRMGPQGKPVRPRLGSAHIKAAACDIWDRDGELWKWCMTNISRLEQLGLYLEDKTCTPSWVHMQCIPPRSGNRIFLP